MIETAYIDGLQLHGGATYRIEAFTIGSPEPRAVALARPSGHGATDGTRWYGPRIFEVVGTVHAASKADLWTALDDLKGALVLGEEHTLRFRRDGLTFDERAAVRIDGAVEVPLSPSNVRPTLRFAFGLYAADPRIYSDTEVSGAYDPTDLGEGGLTFPLTFPLVFDAASGAGSLTVDHEGNIPTPAVFTITGPVTNPIIDNDTTGESIYTQALALDSGETIVIDTGAGTALLGGTTSRPDLIDAAITDWIHLAPGANVLRLRGSDMVATETELAVAYRNARI